MKWSLKQKPAVKTEIVNLLIEILAIEIDNQRRRGLRNKLNERVMDVIMKKVQPLLRNQK